MPINDALDHRCKMGEIWCVHVRMFSGIIKITHLDDFPKVWVFLELSHFVFVHGATLQVEGMDRRL
jgi:hypothetical protein